jgi:hypothetical protein
MTQEGRAFGSKNKRKYLNLPERATVILLVRYSQGKRLVVTLFSNCEVDQEKVFELTRKSHCVEDKLNSTGAIGSQSNTQIGEKWSVLRLLTSGWC